MKNVSDRAESNNSCEACNGRGWGVFNLDSTGKLVVQRCDACEKFDSDEEAEQIALTHLDMAVLKKGGCHTMEEKEKLKKLVQEITDGLTVSGWAEKGGAPLFRILERGEETVKIFAKPDYEDPLYLVVRFAT